MLARISLRIRRADLPARVRLATRKALGQSWDFLRKFLHASPVGIALLIGLSAAGLLVAVSFAFMMLPASRLFELAGDYGRPDDPPGGRVLYFFICLMSAWVAGLTMKALDSWWERFRRPEQAALNVPAGLNNNLGAWLRRAARTAAKLYDISFWIMTAAVGSLMLVRAVRDRELMPIVDRLGFLLAGYFGEALGHVARALHPMPETVRFAASLLIVSFFFYGFAQFFRPKGKADGDHA
jgi:hypothetical protein